MGSSGGGSGATGFTVEELLRQPSLATATLLAGRDGTDRPIRRLNVMTVPEIVRWVEEGEFLLSTGFPLVAHSDPVQLMKDLAGMGLAGLGVKFDSYLPAFADEVVAAADDLAFPILAIPLQTRFDDVLSEAFETIIDRQAAELGRSQRLHRVFLELTFSGGGTQALTGELAKLLRPRVAAVVDHQGQLLAHSGDVEALKPLALPGEREQLDPAALAEGPGAIEGGYVLVEPMRAASVDHGYVVVVGDGEDASEVAATATRQAALVGTLELMRDQAVRAVSGRFSSNLLQELMTSDDLSGVSARAAAVDWVLDRDVTVVVARPDEPSRSRDLGPEQEQLLEQRTLEHWANACRRIDAHAATGLLGAELVVVLAHDDLRDRLGGLHAEMVASTRRGYSLGVSRSHPGPHGVRTAYDEARRALRLGDRVETSGDLTFYDDLGLLRLLAQIDDVELDLFVSDVLGPVLELGEADRAALLQTLDSLLANNFNIAQSAREVHYHYNTLRHRLVKLERLLGPFSTDAPTSRRIGVALEILRMRGTWP